VYGDENEEDFSGGYILMVFRKITKPIDHEKFTNCSPVTMDNVMSLPAKQFKLWTFMRFDALEGRFEDKTNYIMALLLIILAAIIGTVVL